jgi:purine-nucleoside phosphorylase
MSWEKNHFKEICLWRFGSEENVRKMPKLAAIGLGGSASRIAKYLKQITRLGPSFLGTYEGEQIGILACGMGVAEIEATMRAISKSPIEYLIAIGWVGAIDSKICIGDLIVPTIALRGENTTDYYLPKGINVPADETINQKLEKNLIKERIRYFRGLIFTTPAQCKETHQFVRTLKDNDIIGVEMECSVLFTLAKLQGKKASALLVVSDNLSTAETHALDNNLEKKEKEAFDIAVRVALETLVEIGGNVSSTQTNATIANFIIQD